LSEFRKRMDDSFPNLSKEPWSQIPTDLSNYYVVKKFQHGWLMREQKGEKTVFVPTKDLIKIGYKREERTSRVESSRKSWEYSGAIVVPAVPRHQRSKSWDEDGRYIPRVDDRRQETPIIHSEAISIPRVPNGRHEEPISRSCPATEDPTIDISMSDSA